MTRTLKIYMVVKYAADSSESTDIHGFYDNETLAEMAAKKLNENTLTNPYEITEHNLVVRDYNFYKKQCPSSNASREDGNVLLRTSF